MKLGLDRDAATEIFTDKFADCKAYTNPFWIKALMPIGFVWFKNMLQFFIRHPGSLILNWDLSKILQF